LQARHATELFDPHRPHELTEAREVFLDEAQFNAQLIARQPDSGSYAADFPIGKIDWSAPASGREAARSPTIPMERKISDTKNDHVDTASAANHPPWSNPDDLEQGLDCAGLCSACVGVALRPRTHVVRMALRCHVRF
jgi:hypothetical protein